MKIPLIAAAALLATAAPSMAAVTVGTGTSQNCFPFGCHNTPGTVYQQVYAASAFPDAINITGLQFSLLRGNGAFNTGIFTISLSTTAVGVATINTTDFADNIGANNIVKFTGALPALNAGLLTLNFASPFAYDPTAGNLLVDMRVAGGGGGGESFFRAHNGDSTVTSRAHNWGTAFVGWGLNTTFITGTAVVPEPASWAMLIAGFGLVGAAARRRRAVAA